MAVKWLETRKTQELAGKHALEEISNAVKATQDYAKDISDKVIKSESYGYLKNHPVLAIASGVLLGILGTSVVRIARK